MASESGAENARLSLYQSLADEPFRFEFLQALRLIECANPDKSRIGESQRPADDPVRLGQEPSMAFAPATIAEFLLRDDRQPPRMSVLFMGLFGPNGPLPLHLTEYARERMRNNGDEAFARFADLFHHRFLSLFYRAWADAQPTTNFDRLREDRFSTRVSCLIGDGYNPEESRDELDYLRLNFAGRFINQTRNAEGILAILRAYFDNPVKLEQFVGQWLPIPAKARFQLGGDSAAGSLGVDSTLGGKVFSCQHKIRLVFGPLDLAGFQRLLPGGKSLGRLIRIMRHYIGDELDWELKLILKGEEIKPASLGQFGQLGWTSWLPSSFPSESFDELCLDPLQEVI